MLMSTEEPGSCWVWQFPGETAEVSADPLHHALLRTLSLALAVRAGVEVCLDSDCGN